MKDKSLKEEFVGTTVDERKLSAEGWHDQGSLNYYYGMPRIKGLWVKRFGPSYLSPEHAVTVWLFLLLNLDKDKKVKSVYTTVHQVSPDGSFVELEEPLSPADLENMRTACRAVVSP